MPIPAIRGSKSTHRPTPAIQPITQNHDDIDRAALAGFEAHATGKSMPHSFAKDQLLTDAWNVGRRQAADKHAALQSRSRNTSD